ncbi:MAG TPA: S8 family serine peptidase [Casimicrobiaceae bacterium]|nr:S8 family serine peptidase [Casimicrobiaceae bacterium]
MRVDDRSAQRQVLVMLRLAPPHFRPDVDYAGSYDSRVGRDARRRIAGALADQYQLRIIDDWLMPVLGVDCFVMEARNPSPMEGLVEKLSLDPRVESAQSMNLFHVLAYNDPLYSLQPSAKLWHLADLHRIATGKNVRVAEIDTGVEADHPDLAGRIALSRNFVDARTEVAEMHGTAVAGIIAATGNNGIGMVGIAPDARLIALRACWETTARVDAAVCSSFTLAKALQFALSADAQVINLSLGGPRDRLLERLLDTALSRGVTVVGAADPDTVDGGFPASHHGVLAIAGDDAHDVAKDLLRGPGQDIPTTVVDGKWNFVSGSSFAAAHVSGLVALLRELAPGLQPLQIREVLAPRGISGAAVYSSAVVDACAAVERTAGTCACACALARDAKSSPLH